MKLNKHLSRNEYKFEILYLVSFLIHNTSAYGAITSFLPVHFSNVIKLL